MILFFIKRIYIRNFSYSRADKNANLSAYQISEITLFSFGTGISRQFIKPTQTINPHGIDLVFWLNWLMTETGQDASAMQVNAFRSPMISKTIDFRRFQISLDPGSIKKIPNIDALDEKNIILNGCTIWMKKFWAILIWPT